MSYTIKFESYSVFDQMRLSENSGHQEVKMSVFNKEEDSKKEVIFTLPVPGNFNYESAQFSVGEEEARLIINTLKFHFGIKEL